MTECLPEGRLRAWLDRELPSTEMARAAAHLEGCSRCRMLCEELADRTERIADWMETLSGTGIPACVGFEKATQAGTPVPLIVALAATVTAACILLPRSVPPQAEVRNTPQVYMALDNEPVDAGFIVRVALEPGGAPADVIFDSRGHARAIRLVRQP